MQLEGSFSSYGGRSRGIDDAVITDSGIGVNPDVPTVGFVVGWGVGVEAAIGEGAVVDTGES